MHVVRGDHGGPGPRPDRRRRDPRRQGLCHESDPRRLRARARRGSAPALPHGMVMTDDANDEGKMSFFEHLAELRTRIIWSLIPAGIGLVIALYFTDRIMTFLQRPLTKLKTPPVFLTP